MSPNPATWLKDKKARLERKNAFDGSLVHGTAKFNKDTGRNVRSLQPFKEFIDPETGLIRSDMLRPRKCPVCNAAPGPGLFIKEGFRHVRCPTCSLIYVSLILREDILAKYWREEMSWLRVLKSSPQIDMDRLKFSYGLELAQAYLPDGKPGSLLDVGAGTGFFVRLALEQGWKTTAQELNLESYDSLMRDGIQVIVKPLELSDLPLKSFDLVTLWEVLEHLTEPKQILERIFQLLVPQGLLLILVPNAGSLVTRILHDKSNTFGGHSHLNHFTIDSLIYLLNKTDFEILEMETVLTELGTINNHLNFLDPYLGDAPDFFPNLTPEILHDKLWGSRILILARKKNSTQ
ncbi:MAG: class I SAM-dependent methyltransferase [Deltaproteobacteria bacterium]|jgi:SAM-dependent methyltransferase|nr:class I SAM-dependent methyltransferase [Deltaproteobacteria bacterium]